MENTGSLTTVLAGIGPSGWRADASVVRLTARDVAGLLLAGDMYGTPCDLMASFLGVAPARHRGAVAPRRLRADRAAGAGAGVVLADSLWAGRHRAAVCARPARAGPAGAHPRCLSDPPVAASQ